MSDKIFPVIKKDKKIDELTLILVALRNEIIGRLKDAKIADSNFNGHLEDIKGMAEAMINTKRDLDRLISPEKAKP